MKKIGVILAPRASVQKKMPRGIDDQTIYFLFQKIVQREYGRQGDAALRATARKNGVLYVAVKDALWAQELWMHREIFLCELQEKCGEASVRKIVARVME